MEQWLDDSEQEECIASEAALERPAFHAGYTGRAADPNRPGGGQ
jgi:hypothetical protein